jgi:hypothetical protein
VLRVPYWQNPFLQRLRRFFKIEPFKLLCKLGMVAHIVHCLAICFKQTARASRQALPSGPAIIGQKERDIILPWHIAHGSQVYITKFIRVTGVPAGKLYIIISNIVTIPAKNHIAKTITIFKPSRNFWVLITLPRKTPSISAKANFTFWILFSLM